MTNNTLARFSIVVSLAVAPFAAWGCDSSPSRNPTSPGVVEPRPTFTLAGVVTQETTSGPTPVEGALVKEMRSQQGATTDADGNYRLSGLSAGDAILSVVKDGYVTATKNVSISADTRLDLRIQPMIAYILSGAVFEMTPAGRVPVEGVTLYCDSCGSPVGHTFASSDAEGRYSFAWSMNGVHPIQVWKDGLALAHPAGSYGNGAEYINATVNGDTQLDIEVVRR